MGGRVKDNGFTERQISFICHYVIEPNATQAAIRAGYSKASAYSQGERLLKNVEIMREIERKKAHMAVKYERTAADVLKDIQDITQEARDAGNQAAALKGVEMEAKYLGMFVQKVDHSSSDGTMSPVKAIDLSDMDIDALADLAQKIFSK